MKGRASLAAKEPRPSRQGAEIPLRAAQSSATVHYTQSLSEKKKNALGISRARAAARLQLTLKNFCGALNVDVTPK